MSRFLICSFALVLLYPAGIDMYLVGLPRIAADLNAHYSRSACNQSSQEVSQSDVHGLGRQSYSGDCHSLWYNRDFVLVRQRL